MWVRTACRAASFQFTSSAWRDQQNFIETERNDRFFLCHLSGGETATRESAVRDSQDTTEAGRAVCPAWGARGRGGGEVNYRWKGVSDRRNVLYLLLPWTQSWFHEPEILNLFLGFKTLEFNSLQCEQYGRLKQPKSEINRASLKMHQSY